jgi:hypothetical protein
MLALCVGHVNGENPDNVFAPASLSEGIRLICLGDNGGAANVLQSEVKKAGISFDWCTTLDELTQVVALQEALAKEKDMAQWVELAELLKQFYRKLGLESEEILLAKKIFARVRSLQSILDVVDTCIETKHFDEAESVIEYFELKYKNSREYFAAVGIAKCRLYLAANSPESARKTVRTIDSAEIEAPEILLALAYVQVATRQYASSVRTLGRCFAATPPEEIDALRTQILRSADFQTVSDSPEFAKAINTPSAVTAVTTAATEESCRACALAKWRKLNELLGRTAAFDASKPLFLNETINTADWKCR